MLNHVQGTSNIDDTKDYNSLANYPDRSWKGTRDFYLSLKEKVGVTAAKELLLLACPKLTEEEKVWVFSDDNGQGEM